MDTQKIYKQRDKKLAEKLEEFSAERDKILHRELDDVKEKIFIHINKRLEEFPVHEMSSETREKITSLEKNNICINNKIDQLITITTNNGKITNEMYTFYTSSGWTFKMVLKIFLGVGAVTGGIIGIMEVYKKMKVP